MQRYLIGGCLVLFLLLGASTWALHRRVQEVARLEASVASLELQRAQVEASLSTALKSAQRARQQAQEASRALRELRKVDPAAGEWLDQRIPDSVRDRLNTPGA